MAMFQLKRAADATRPRYRNGLADQSGSVVILLALAITALMGVGVLVVDTGLLRVTHAQLQTAAGASALAGTTGLRTRGEEGAWELASEVALANRALADQMRPITLLPDGLVITDSRRVHVTLSRGPDSGGSMQAVFAPLVGLDRDRTVSASAEAEMIELCSTEMLRPLVVPDRWSDVNADGIWDPGEPYSPDATGYRPMRDEGLVLRLTPFEPRGSEPATVDSYLRIRLPPVDSGHPPRPGVGNYRRYLDQGAPYVVSVGDDVELEVVPVHMTTYRVLTDLIARDPGAHWDPQSMTVVSQAEGLSPRVVKLALIDPSTVPEVPMPRNERRLEVHITRLAAAFVEDVDCDGSITLRFVPVADQGEQCFGAETSFIYRARIRRYFHHAD